MHREQYGATAARPRSPLIGRSVQLSLLEGLHERAMDGAGGAALLWGEAGIGKTRLLDEFAAAAQVRGTRIGAAACFESLCPPFAPVREAYAELGIAEPFAPQPEAPAPGPDVAQYRALVDAVTTLKAAAPLVLAIDDLQWADFGTLEFLAFLTPRLASSQVLVLATVRSDGLENDHRRLEALARLGRAGAVTIVIPPLEDRDMRRLVAGLWPEPAADRERAIDRVCALAEGKPYFAEELVHSAVAGRDGPAFGGPPLSIRAGVLARFEKLAPDERRIMLVASVIGRGFDAPLLTEVTEQSGDAVARTLARARDEDLVREVRESPGRFVFRHAIAREILYHELLAFETQRIHAEIARRLDERGDADPFDLAHHWNAADDAKRASLAYEDAGDAAVARHAWHDAEAAYRGAERAANERDARYAHLCDKLSRASSVNGDVGAACECTARAVDAYVAAGDAARAAALSLRLARRLYERGDAVAAEAAAHRGLELGGGPIAYEAAVTLAHFAVLQGQNAAAAAHLAAAARLRGQRSPMQRRDFHLVRALVRATSGRLASAFDDYQKAARLARALDEPEQLAWTLNNYASRAMTTGHMRRANAAHLAASSALRGYELSKLAAFTAQGCAFAHLLQGDLDAARHIQLADLEGAPGIAMTQTSRAAVGVRLTYYAGDDAGADRFATAEAMDRAFASGETQNLGLLAGCVAAHYDETDRREEAAALRARALRSLRSFDYSFWLLDQLAAGANPAERHAARAIIERAANDPAHLAARAYLLLFDARVARASRKPGAKEIAADAAAAFEAIGWPWERAQALEIAGRYAEALDVYRRHGFERHAVKLADRRRRARHRTGRRALTKRELEVARLAAAGESNRAIAQRLFIGERTVETHIASIFDRFDLASRRQLSALVDELGEPPGEVTEKPSP